ncbi:unnamed protein product [Brassicogethes aeneus]|uniref:Uncharacterized protein n=1 Tax=Brassicogethes aeneus TaxID=1431903 RepID=A0A9P0BA27_BRAAE|nr:unnamed protein product [Brassicogethes aeneus]
MNADIDEMQAIASKIITSMPDVCGKEGKSSNILDDFPSLLPDIYRCPTSLQAITGHKTSFGFHPHMPVLFQQVLLMVYISGFGITAGAHRLWSHRAYKAKWPLRLLLVFLFTITGQRATFSVRTIDQVVTKRNELAYAKASAHLLKYKICRHLGTRPLMKDRTGVSDCTAAIIAKAVLEDIGILSKPQSTQQDIAHGRQQCHK